MDISSLVKLGLSKNEARVYLACLGLGVSNATHISMQAKIPRSTVYGNLDSLVSKGFVFTYPKKGKKYFSANNPRFLQKKADDFSRNVGDLLPALESFYYSKNAQRPRVRYFEGSYGIEVVIEELLSEASEILIIGSVDNEFMELKDILESAVKKRKSLGISDRFITNDSPMARTMRKKDDSLSQTKIISTNKPLTSVMYLWKDKTVLFSLVGDKSITIIEDRETYEMHKNMFESIWQFHPEVK